MHTHAQPTLTCQHDWKRISRPRLEVCSENSHLLFAAKSNDFGALILVCNGKVYTYCSAKLLSNFALQIIIIK